MEHRAVPLLLPQPVHVQCTSHLVHLQVHSNDPQCLVDIEVTICKEEQAQGSLSMMQPHIWETYTCIAVNVSF